MYEGQKVVLNHSLHAVIILISTVRWPGGMSRRCHLHGLLPMLWALGACLWYLMSFCPVIGWRWGPGCFAIPRQKCVHFGEILPRLKRLHRGQGCILPLPITPPLPPLSPAPTGCVPLGSESLTLGFSKKSFFYIWTCVWSCTCTWKVACSICSTHLNLFLPLSLSLPPPLFLSLLLSANICLCTFLWC